MENVLNSSLAVGFYYTFLDWQQHVNQSHFSPAHQLQVLTHNHSIALISALICLLLLLYWILVPINLVRVSNRSRCTARHSRPPYLTLQTQDWSESQQNDNPRSHDIPPVYPNGWVPIAESRDVTSTRIVKAQVHVNQVIVLRKEDGKTAVYDAYCPHLGADLSVGGEIVTGGASPCIKCPFHGWSFSTADGSCVQVPYANDHSE